MSDPFSDEGFQEAKDRARRRTERIDYQRMLSDQHYNNHNRGAKKLGTYFGYLYLGAVGMIVVMWIIIAID